MSLELFHPAIARLHCTDCCRRLHDMETGKPLTYVAGPAKEQRFFDGPDHRPPCRTGWNCPKVSPEEASRHQLSEKNRRVFMLFLQAQATWGKSLERGGVDPLLADNFAIVAALFQRWQREQAARESGRAVASEIHALLEGRILR